MWWIFFRKKRKPVLSANDPILPKKISDIPKFMRDNPAPTSRETPIRHEDDEGIQTGIVVGMGVDSQL